MVTLVKAKKDCLKRLHKTIKAIRAGSLSSSGNEFQIVGPAIEKAQRP